MKINEEQKTNLRTAIEISIIANNFAMKAQKIVVRTVKNYVKDAEAMFRDIESDINIYECENREYRKLYEGLESGRTDGLNICMLSGCKHMLENGEIDKGTASKLIKSIDEVLNQIND